MIEADSKEHNTRCNSSIITVVCIYAGLPLDLCRLTKETSYWGTERRMVSDKHLGKKTLQRSWEKVCTPLMAWKIILQPVILDLPVVFPKLCQGSNRDA